MTDEATPQMPNPKLATEDWTLKELKDTENRIEKAFHDQTRYLTDKIANIKDDINTKIDSQTRWMVGLMITMTIAIIIAVLFK